MDAEEARAATAPGGPLEFVHAGGKIEVPAVPDGEPSGHTANGMRAFEMWAALFNTMFVACEFGRSTLFVGPHGSEAVLISRVRYDELVAAEAGRAAMLAEAALVGREAMDRLVVLESSHGCEAAAEKAGLGGRLAALDRITGAEPLPAAAESTRP